MDEASAHGAGDCKLESYQDHTVWTILWTFLLAQTWALKGRRHQ